MTNFIFKSSGLISKISNQLEMVLTEQRHQRADLAEILRCIHSLTIDKHLQTQVDDFHDDSSVASLQESDGL